MAHNDKVLGAEGEGEVRLPLPPAHLESPRASFVCIRHTWYVPHCLCAHLLSLVIETSCMFTAVWATVVPAV